MIYLQITELIAAQKIKWGRRVTLTEVSDATGISRMTLTRMVKSRGYNTVTDHLDKLCAYFECDIHDLVQYIPDSNPPIAKHHILSFASVTSREQSVCNL